MINKTTWKTTKKNMRKVSKLDPESPESGVQKWYSPDLRCYTKTVKELHAIWEGLK